MQVEQVRRYVLTSLVCAVVLLHSAAIALLGVTMNGAGGSRQGLFVLSTLFGALAIGIVRLIMKKSILTFWLLGALVLPTLIYVIWFKVVH